MVPTFFPDLKLTLASRALSRGKSELFIAFLSSLELALPDTIKRAKNHKNRGKTLNYFPNLGLDTNYFPPPQAPQKWTLYTRGLLPQWKMKKKSFFLMIFKQFEVL